MPPPRLVMERCQEDTHPQAHPSAMVRRVLLPRKFCALLTARTGVIWDEPLARQRVVIEIDAREAPAAAEMYISRARSGARLPVSRGVDLAVLSQTGRPEGIKRDLRKCRRRRRGAAEVT